MGASKFQIGSIVCLWPTTFYLTGLTGMYSGKSRALNYICPLLLLSVTAFGFSDEIIHWEDMSLSIPPVIIIGFMKHLIIQRINQRTDMLLLVCVINPAI